MLDFKCEFYTIGANRNSLELYTTSCLVQNVESEIDAINLAAVAIAKRHPNRILITKKDLVLISWDYLKVIKTTTSKAPVDCGQFSLESSKIEYKFDVADKKTISISEIHPRFLIGSSGKISNLLKYSNEGFSKTFLEQVENSPLNNEKFHYENVSDKSRNLYNHCSNDTKKMVVNNIKAQ